MVRYFEWMGAARYTADRRSGSMHGKQFLLDAVYAGIDDRFVYGRLDFAGKIPEEEYEIVVNVESWANHDLIPRSEVRLEAVVVGGRLQSWKITAPNSRNALASSTDPREARAALARNFEFRLPQAWLQAAPVNVEQRSDVATRLRLRFSLWSNRLPVDALPVEGWIDLELLPEEDLVEQ